MTGVLPSQTLRDMVERQEITLAAPLVEGQIADTAKSRGMTEDEVKKNVLLAAQPTKEFVTSEQVAAMAAFLVSPDADQINGTLMQIDGGWVAQ